VAVVTGALGVIVEEDTARVRVGLPVDPPPPPKGGVPESPPPPPQAASVSSASTEKSLLSTFIMVIVRSPGATAKGRDYNAPPDGR
jgi:hypothetical protein